MITVTEVLERFKFYKNIGDPVGIDIADFTELLTHLQQENALLKSTLSEIKKHQTACNALKFALARVRELEDLLKKQEDDQ